MLQLEDSVFDKTYGLFTGPAVFQDGIAAYDEPVYEPSFDDKSYVLDHPNSHHIMCLSTNAVYYQAYICLAEMAEICEPAAVKAYRNKAKALKRSFRRHFYNKSEGKLYYLIDHQGRKHDYQEALGVAYTILFRLVSKSEARHIITHSYRSANGVPAVWPCFPRFSKEKPGRQNVMIWPHVNMFFAAACAQAGMKDTFWDEVNAITVGTEVPPHWFRGWKAGSGERHPIPQRVARRHHQRHGLTCQLVQGERQRVKAFHPIVSYRKNRNNYILKLT